MTERYRLRFPGADDQQNRLIHELASFAIRQPLERVLGASAEIAQQLVIAKKYLKQTPGAQTQPRPDSLRLFREIVDNRLNEQAAEPDTYRTPTI